jgi:uncharacterized protein (TIGR02246 family)
MSECSVETLYRNLLERWNESDAAGFASLFRHDGSMVGFDGTAVETAPRIRDHVATIFADHQQPTYVWKVLEIRPLGSDAALLQAVAGLIPPGDWRVKPELNAAQVMVALRRNSDWLVAHLQNTPVALEGKPEESAALTEELQALVPANA